MKKIAYIFLAIALLCNNVYGTTQQPIGSRQDSIMLLTTTDLKDLVTSWTNEYSNARQKTAIRIGTISTVPSGHMLKPGEIVFVNDGNLPGGMPDEKELRIVVGRNVIVPIINSSNPYLEEILAKGISPEKMKMMIEGLQVKWGDILNGEQDHEIKLNYLDDPMVIEAIASFAASDQEKINGRYFTSGSDIISETGGDVFSVGFCKLSDLQNLAEGSIPEKISILPIDKNGNGIIDSGEDIYSDLTSFTRGVWIGKYPKSLYSSVFSLTGTPVTDNVSAFLNWVITDGQKILTNEGYSGLILTERISDAGKLSEAMVRPAGNMGNQNIFRSLLMVLIILSGGVFIIFLIVRYLRKKPVADTLVIRSEGHVLDEKSILLPKGVYFDKTHTWAFMEQDGTVKVGVDDFLLHITGPVNRIKMKEAGERVKRGDEILSVINNGKQLHLYSPLTGVINELNHGLESSAEILNSSPYASGWVYRVVPENWPRESQLLFMADKHRQFIQNEIIRIKDFLASLLHNENMQYSPIILQDGGMLREGVLSDMNPEVWEEFQTKIIDPSKTVWFYEII